MTLLAVNVLTVTCHWEGSGCGSVGRAVAFRHRRSASSANFYIEHLFTVNCKENSKIKKKRPRIFQQKHAIGLFAHLKVGIRTWDRHNVPYNWLFDHCSCYLWFLFFIFFWHFLSSMFLEASCTRSSQIFCCSCLLLPFQKKPQKVFSKIKMVE